MGQKMAAMVARDALAKGCVFGQEKMILRGPDRFQIQKLAQMPTP
jgi:hypothetical protein